MITAEEFLTQILKELHSVDMCPLRAKDGYECTIECMCEDCQNKLNKLFDTAAETLFGQPGTGIQ